MGSALDSQQSGQSETEWVPMAEGLWRFDIGEITIELSGFKNDDGSDKYRVSIPLQLTESEYERAKELANLTDNQQVSGRTKYRVGLGAKYPLGFYRDGTYVSTKLADFLCVVFGSKQTNRARKFLEQGGSPDYSQAQTYEEQIKTLETWLNWMNQCQVYGTITHSEDKKVPGKFWGNFGGPLAVGALPGQPEPDYQAFGAAKLRALMTNIETASPAEQGVAAGAALVEQEEARQPELVTAAAKPQPATRSYEDVFGDED
jgi:hypothetical protein